MFDTNEQAAAYFMDQRAQRDAVVRQASREQREAERAAAWQAELGARQRKEDGEKERSDAQAAQRQARERQMAEAVRRQNEEAQRRKAELAAEVAACQSILNATFSGTAAVNALAPDLLDKLQAHVLRMAAEDQLRRATGAAEAFENQARQQGRALGQAAAQAGTRGFR